MVESEATFSRGLRFDDLSLTIDHELLIKTHAYLVKSCLVVGVWEILVSAADRVLSGVARVFLGPVLVQRG